MSCHQTSSTMSGHNECRKRQSLPIVLLLFVMWTIMCTGAAARPTMDAFSSEQNNGAQLYLDELLLANTNGDNLIHELKKYHQKQPNYLSKWPGLRDLVLTIDYDDEIVGSMAENNEILNYKLLERLRQLTPSSEFNSGQVTDIREENGEDPAVNMPLKSTKQTSNHIAYKEHNAKKNVQYMSPCHFKICNMGRKRDARRLLANNY